MGKTEQETVNGDLYALVTGASRGLGKQYAIELARRNINVLLVALADDGLPELCNHIRETYKIKCDYFATDLTKAENIGKLVKWTLDNYRVNILINNAGMGGSKEFELADFDYLDSMISLNIRALTLITHQLLPELKSHGQSFILNVASMASFTPLGYKTIYPATKVYVLYFTRGLRQELKGTGVTASVVHPGPMKTNSHVIKRIEKIGMFARFGLLSPEYVAGRSLNLLFRKKPLIILGWFNQLCWLGMKAVPSPLWLPMVTRMFKKELAASKKQPC
jgi:uncharacterized protein